MVRIYIFLPLVKHVMLSWFWIWDDCSITSENVRIKLKFNGRTFQALTHQQHIDRENRTYMQTSHWFILHVCIMQTE